MHTFFSVEDIEDSPRRSFYSREVGFAAAVTAGPSYLVRLTLHDIFIPMIHGGTNCLSRYVPHSCLFIVSNQTIPGINSITPLDSSRAVIFAYIGNWRCLHARRDSIVFRSSELR